MKHFWKSLVLAAGIACVGGAALAADVVKPLPPVVVRAANFDWNGLYLGVNGGGGWGRADRTGTSVNEFSTNGPFVGGQLGWNMASGGLVWGLEGDAQWSGIKGSCNGTCGAPQLTTHDINWFASARGRLGMISGPTGNMLWYVTGGWAWASATRQTSAGGGASVSNTHSGWTAGAGVEWAVATKLTAKVEYDFLSLNAKLYNFPVGIDPNVQLPTHTLRFGLNWHL